MLQKKLLPMLLVAVFLSCVDAHASRGLTVVGQGGQKVGSFTGSYALLIGVSDYRAGWPKLESVPGELAKVEAALKAQGFSVQKVVDPDGKGLQRAFEDFIDKYGYGKDNRLLFYFSGHGHTMDGGSKGYLVPVDAPDPRQDEINFRRKALDMTLILAWSRQMTSRHALFLFDSCFSGTIFKTKALPDTPPHITAMTAEPVRQFLTAGSSGETVPARSVFTPAFIDALQYGDGDLDKDGFVTGYELGLYLQKKVPKFARQTPQFGVIDKYNLSRGDFVFQIADGSPSPPIPPPAGSNKASIKVESEPSGATVYIDGQRKGVTPLDVTGLSPAQVTVRLEKDGYTQPWRSPCGFQPGRACTCRWSCIRLCEKARLTVSDHAFRRHGEDPEHRPSGIATAWNWTRGGNHVEVSRVRDTRAFSRWVELSAGQNLTIAGGTVAGSGRRPGPSRASSLAFGQDVDRSGHGHGVRVGAGRMLPDGLAFGRKGSR